MRSSHRKQMAKSNKNRKGGVDMNSRKEKDSKRIVMSSQEKGNKMREENRNRVGNKKNREKINKDANSSKANNKPIKPSKMMKNRVTNIMPYPYW